MPGRSRKSSRVPDAHRKRVGAFVRKRRIDLGLSQSAVARALHFKQRASISNIELGVEGLPPKRVYAWAEVLRVPPDAFFQFVVGATHEMVIESNEHRDSAGEKLSQIETLLIEKFRSLGKKEQRRLLDAVDAFITEARPSKGRGVRRD